MIFALKVIGVVLGLFLVWRGFKEWRADKKIRVDWEKLHELGYKSGLAGLPPDFYREILGSFLDVADEFAIGKGWDKGWREFKENDLKNEMRKQIN